MNILAIVSFTALSCWLAPQKEPVSETAVYCYLKSIGVKNPRTVLKQAIFESGHFKSRIFKAKNNLFGFRRTKTYMSFNSWQASCDYYKKWQEKNYKNEEEDYLKFLQRKNYAGNKSYNYAGNLKKIKIRGNLLCDTTLVDTLQTYTTQVNQTPIDSIKVN